MESKSVEEYSYQWPAGTPIAAIDMGTSRSAMSITYVGKEKHSQGNSLMKNTTITVILE